MKKKVVLVGGSGLLGRHLTRQLASQHVDVKTLTRSNTGATIGNSEITWDGETLGDWVDELEGAAAIVHLSGKRVDCRPTNRNIEELISSRVKPVLTIGSALTRLKQPPPVWVQVSSLAIFGDHGDAPVGEDTFPSGLGPQQMVQVCLAWEAAFRKATENVERTVLLRAGIAIGGADDPATRRLAALARYGLGGRIGNGKQWVSWIALEDLIALFKRAMTDESMSGLYHACSPNPVKNSEMMSTIRSLLGRQVGVPAPRSVTTIGSWVLGTDPALALTGRRGIPRRLIDENWRFALPMFEDAAAEAILSIN